MILLAMLLLLPGCAALIGQPSITMPELISLIEAQHGSGCVYAVGAYPPFGQLKVIAEWGEHPPDYCKPF